jgi:iron complex outermembrane receptor protein
MKTRISKTHLLILTIFLFAGSLTAKRSDNSSILDNIVPAVVFTSEQISQTGYTETARVIQSLLPGFNLSVSTISDGTDLIRPATLRGMQPDQILVLVNGKRRHNSALLHINGSIGRGSSGFDLDAIPISAIDQIEILFDTDVSRYGSDAIAGVINIILKTETETAITLYGGQTLEEDGATMNVSINHGFSIGKEGYINLTTEYEKGDFTNRAGLDQRRIFNYLEQEFGQPALSTGTSDPREETYDRLNHRYGEPKSRNMRLFINSEIPLKYNIDLYFFGGVTNKDSESAMFNRLPSQSRTNILLFSEGHMPLLNGIINDFSLNTGIRKYFSGWELDAGINGGYNTFNFKISNSANTSLGTNSPTSVDAGILGYSLAALTVNLSGSSDWGLANPVDIDLGFEARQESYKIEAGDKESWIDGGVTDQFGGVSPAGIQGFPGFRPSNEIRESRNILALYADFKFKPVDKLQLGLTSRYDNYSDIGSNLSNKIALGYEFSKALILRGSVSTGFRAPSLQQTYFNNSSTQFVFVESALVPLTVGTFNNDSEVTRALGISDLDEERFHAFSTDFIIHPIQNLVISTTLFGVDVKDRIIISGRMSSSDKTIAPILQPFDVNAAQVLTNAIDTRTRGADISLSWILPLSNTQSLSLTAGAHWNETKVTGNVSVPDSLKGLEETIFDRREEAYIERGQPGERYTIQIIYNHSRFSGLLRFNKFGSVKSVESPSSPNLDQTYSGKWLTDLELSYNIYKGISIAAGGTNIFDVYPDKNKEEISFNGIFIYPRRVAPFGFMGGFYYARLIFNI